MAKLKKNQVRSLVYRYLLNQGWLPPGTTVTSWPDVTIGDLGIDDPALPSDPDLQKKRIALDLQELVATLGSQIPTPLPLLRKVSKTLGEFADALFESQV
jgi:hypothetical protein